MKTRSRSALVALLALMAAAGTALFAASDAGAASGQTPRASEAAHVSSVTDERPVVYIASPYTRGDPAINTHFQCSIWNKLMDDGFVWPVAPLWSHFQHTIFPRRYQDWVAYDFAMIRRYDACLRLEAQFDALDYHEGKSSGADAEVAEFKRLGKPVFYSIDELYAWVKTRKK